MKVRMLVAITIAGATSAALLISSRTPLFGDEKKPQQPAAKPSAKQRPSTPAPAALSSEALAKLAAENPPKYTVQPYRDFPGQIGSDEEEARLKKVCDLLMQIKPEPAERVAYFAWMKRPDCPFQFRSWGCMLREAKPVAGGWNVTLQAMARGTDANGSYYDVFNRYMEEYALTETGQIKFLRGYPHPDDGNGKPNFRKYK